MLPGREGVLEGAITRDALLDRQDGAAAVVVDDRDVEPGPLLEQRDVALLVRIRGGQAEQTRGVPLAGSAVKVMDGYFLIGLSATDTEMQRNISLLKDRPWFDVPIVYTDGRRAILAVEKGTPCDRAFKDAFAAWNQ